MATKADARLVQTAKTEGSKLFAEHLSFYDEAQVIQTTLTEVWETGLEDGCATNGVCYFSTYDYVFYPVSKKPPMEE